MALKCSCHYNCCGRASDFVAIAMVAVSDVAIIIVLMMVVMNCCIGNSDI